MQCTGYTSILFQNTGEVSFETFAKNCLRTFISCEKCNVFEEEFLETIQSNDYNLVMINKDCKRLIEVVSENFTIESYRSDLRETIKCCKEQLIKLSNKKLKVLILGYKTRGKGENYKHEFEKDIFLNIEFLKQNILKLTPLFKVVSFDNLAIEQLELQKQINPKVWDEFYMGDDGKHTMYIDLVEQTFSKNSLGEETFDLMSNIEEMFKIVKKL